MATILLIDREISFCGSLALTLEREGYKIITASTSREAWAAMGRMTPDLIVLNPELPLAHGILFFRSLRANPKTVKVPVIVLANMASKPQIMAAAEHGVKDYLLKRSLKPGELAERIARRLPGKSSPASTPLQAVPAKTPASPPDAASSLPAGPMMQLLSREQCITRAEKAMEGKALSGVVAQVVAMAGSPRGDAGHLVSLIVKDPMLAVRILQAANSAVYTSASGPVNNIGDAIKKIGFSKVRNIAAALGVVGALPAGDTSGFNPVRSWQHSFAAAILCEKFATVVGGADSDGIAYLIGLCHDLGEILFQTSFGTEYRQVLEVEQRSGQSRMQVERAMLGISHGELVMTILRCMGLPDSIRGPIEAMHSAQRVTPLNQNLVRALRLADVYANGMLLAIGSSALVYPVPRSECRMLLGQDNPPALDAEQIRAEIFTMTALVARSPGPDDARLMALLYPRSDTKVWVARDRYYSTFDPIATMFGGIATAVSHERLPSLEEREDIEALVIVTRDLGTPGFNAEQVRLIETKRSGQKIPILWLTERVGPVAVASDVKPLPLPVKLENLASFMMGIETKVSARNQAA